MKKNDRMYAKNALRKKQLRQHSSLGRKSSFVPESESGSGLKKLIIIMPILIIVLLIILLAVGISQFTGILDNSRQTKTETVEKSKPVEYDESKLLLVISPESPLPSDYKTDLVDYENIKVDRCISESLSEMMKASQDSGIDLKLTGGYISPEIQHKSFQAEVSRLQTDEGLSKANAEAQAEKTVTAENHSEFQSGLAVTLSGGTEKEFSETEEFRWLESNSTKYGFILRYPEGKEKSTGFDFDPTHFRYVGKENALQMRTLSMTLEEYNEYLASR